MMLFLHPSTQEYKWCLLHRPTSTPADQEVSTPEQQCKSPSWCKGDRTEATFKFSSPRAPNPHALLPVIWASLASNNSGRAAKRPALHLQKWCCLGAKYAWPPCRQSSPWRASLEDRQTEWPFLLPALGHPSNAIIQPPTVSRAVLLPFSQWGCGGRCILGCGVSIVLRALSVVVPRTAACLACRNAQRPWSG